MKYIIVTAILAAFLALSPVVLLAQPPDVPESSNWSKWIHEENSLSASLLYIPYMIVQFPGRLIDAIIYPKPASMATVPPAAHKVPAQ
jgi:hypothetical protein